MDGLREPVGDQPAKVYWVRRLIVVIVAIALIAGLWFVVSGLFSGNGEDPAADPSASPDVTTSAEAAAPPADDPSRPCTAEDATVTAVASPENVNVGSMPAFEVSVEHTGASACSLSSTTEGTALVVRSGSDVYFNSAWCPDLPVFPEANWILQPGDREALQATWTGQRYSESCEPGDNAPAGNFRAAISVGPIAAEEAPFAMVE